jgi:hypothetical protein
VSAWIYRNTSKYDSDFADMKEAGYTTHQVGKWDAGMATLDHTPKGRKGL